MENQLDKKREDNMDATDVLKFDGSQLAGTSEEQFCPVIRCSVAMRVDNLMLLRGSLVKILCPYPKHKPWAHSGLAKPVYHT